MLILRAVPPSSTGNVAWPETNVVLVELRKRGGDMAVLLREVGCEDFEHDAAHIICSRTSSRRCACSPPAAHVLRRCGSQVPEVTRAAIKSDAEKSADSELASEVRTSAATPARAACRCAISHMRNSLMCSYLTPLTHDGGVHLAPSVRQIVQRAEIAREKAQALRHIALGRK